MRRVNVRCHWLDNPMNVTLIGLRADESDFHRVNLRGQRHIYPVDLRGATPGSAGSAETPGSSGMPTARLFCGEELVGCGQALVGRPQQGRQVFAPDQHGGRLEDPQEQVGCGRGGRGHRPQPRRAEPG